MRGGQPTGQDRAYVLGLDLGQSGALTAAAAYWPVTGRLEAVACVGGIPDLRVRGRRDNVGGLYETMARRGELLVHAGLRVPDYGEFVRQVVDRWGAPSVIVADRYKEAELRSALDAGRMRRGLPLVTRGQGWKDGGEDVRRFRRGVLRERVKAARSLLIRSALSEARTITDVAGTAKLAKGSEGQRRKLGRDDVAAAAILAVAEADRRGLPSTGRRGRSAWWPSEWPVKPGVWHIAGGCCSVRCRGGIVRHGDSDHVRARRGA